MEKVYGYARVSTREQNLDRQIAALRQYVTDERDIITDKRRAARTLTAPAISISASGSSARRHAHRKESPTGSGATRSR